MYHVKTDLGTFWIHLSLPGTYELRLNHHRIGFYRDPNAAALDVACCNTGLTAWDRKLLVSIPGNLDDWEQGSPYVEYEELEEEENLVYRDAAQPWKSRRSASSLERRRPEKEIPP